MKLNIHGMDIKINPLLCIVLIAFFIQGYLMDLFISFLVVIFHEGIHVLAAKKLGYKVEGIEIFPFGGVARIENGMVVNPYHEVIIAASAPIFNLIIVIIGLCFCKLFLLYDERLLFFVKTNLIIGTFNLLPIFPLDGGRIIRAYLAYIIGFKKATKGVVILSKSISVLLLLWGVYSIRFHTLNVYMVFLSIFLYRAAHEEKKMAAFIFIKEMIRKKKSIKKFKILKTKYLTASKNTYIKDIMYQFSFGNYHVITVIDARKKVIGVLTENQLLEGMMQYGIHVSLEKLLRH